MNSIAIIITVKVHYTACEGMDCSFNFNVFLISWIHHFLLPFLPQQAVSRLRTNLYQLYVYWKYSYKISTWHAELFKENLWIRTIRTGSFVVSQKIKTNAKITNQDLLQVESLVQTDTTLLANNSQHLQITESLTSFKLCATTPKNTQQQATGCTNIQRRCVCLHVAKDHSSLSTTEREGRGKTFQAHSAVIYCQQQDSESLPNCYQPGRRECGHVKLYWQINNWKAHAIPNKLNYLSLLMVAKEELHKSSHSFFLNS